MYCIESCATVIYDVFGGLGLLNDHGAKCGAKYGKDDKSDATQYVWQGGWFFHAGNRYPMLV